MHLPRLAPRLLPKAAPIEDWIDQLSRLMLVLLLLATLGSLV